MAQVTELAAYKVEDGGTHWVVAASDEDAVDVVREFHGMTREQYLNEVAVDGIEVVQLKPHETVKVVGLAGTANEPGFTPELLRRGSWSVEFSAAALSEHHERGVVCSTEF